jgi:segregation and condensation protein B
MTDTPPEPEHPAEAEAAGGSETPDAAAPPDDAGAYESPDAASGGLFDTPEPEDAAGAAEPSLRAGLEAILLVVDEPVPEVTLAQILERPREEVSVTLRELAAEYTAQARGFDLREIAGGWRFYTRDVCAPLVERFVRDGQAARLTQAALETLAVIAYRQPVSRARVSAIRGVNSDGVIRTLTLRGLIEEAGHDPEHQAVLYRTTTYFLERLGLNAVDELPELAPYLPDDLEGIEELQQ